MKLTVMARAAEMRPCAGCTACCHALMVESLQKAPATACQHVSMTGCGIHGEQPAECRAFDCAWRATAADGPLGLQELDRPDRSGLVLWWNRNLDAWAASEAFPGALDGVSAHGLLERLGAQGLPVVVFGGADVKFVLAPEGDQIVGRVQRLIEERASCGA